MLVANGGKNWPSTVESSHMLMAKPPYIAAAKSALDTGSGPSAHTHTGAATDWSMDKIWVVEVEYGWTMGVVPDRLVVSNINFIFHFIYGIILPIDFHIFQDG